MRHQKLTSQILLIFIVVSQFVIQSCKEKGSKTSESLPRGISIVATSKDLPQCDKNLADQIIYVEDEKKFKICKEADWGDLVLEGEKGEPGEAGVSNNLVDVWRKVWKASILSSVFIESKYVESGKPRDCTTCCRILEAGSGFVVGDNIVATNGHVAKSSQAVTCGQVDLASMRIWFPTSTKGDTKHNEVGPAAEVSQIDRTIEHTDDLVLLKVATDEKAALPLSKKDEASDHLTGEGVKIGDQVLLLGYSGASTYAHFVTGTINAIQQTGPNFLSSFIQQNIVSAGKTVYQYDLVSGGGASGGAVLSTDGEVVGINFAGNTAEADTEFGFAVQAKPLRKLLGNDRDWKDL